jgi:hypothetical protein
MTNRYKFLTTFKNLCEVYGLRYSQAIFRPIRFNGKIELEFYVGNRRLWLKDFNESNAEALILLITTFADSDPEFTNVTDIDVLAPAMQDRVHSFYMPLSHYKLTFNEEYELWEAFYEQEGEESKPFYLEQDLSVLSTEYLSEISSAYEQFMSIRKPNNETEPKTLSREDAKNSNWYDRPSTSKTGNKLVPDEMIEDFEKNGLSNDQTKVINQYNKSEAERLDIEKTRAYVPSVSDELVFERPSSTQYYPNILGLTKEQTKAFINDEVDNDIPFKVVKGEPVTKTPDFEPMTKIVEEKKDVTPNKEEFYRLLGEKPKVAKRQPSTLVAMPLETLSESDKELLDGHIGEPLVIERVTHDRGFTELNAALDIAIRENKYETLNYKVVLPDIELRSESEYNLFKNRCIAEFSEYLNQVFVYDTGRSKTGN